jgi:hypothetical protein
VNSKEGKFVFEGDCVYRDKIIKRKMEMNGNKAQNRTRGSRVKLRQEQQKERISGMNERREKNKVNAVKRNMTPCRFVQGSSVWKKFAATSFESCRENRKPTGWCCAVSRLQVDPVTGSV